ncbi:MAG: helix-turn-helix domain-containing protein [Anaerolineae bacterium]
MDQEAIALRNRMIGLLLRDARLRAGRTKQECANWLGVPVSTLTAYEEGRKPVSLPELEALAFFLDVPVQHFWDPDAQLLIEESTPPVQEILAIRHRMIGALLQQARREAGKSRKDLAQSLGCSVRRIAAYEQGEQPVPMAELEILANALNRPIEYFLDSSGLIGKWEAEQQAFRVFRQLPPEIQEFVSRPINRSYLEVAMKLAEMPASALRQIAEGLLEITY